MSKKRELERGVRTDVPSSLAMINTHTHTHTHTHTLLDSSVDNVPVAYSRSLEGYIT